MPAGRVLVVQPAFLGDAVFTSALVDALAERFAEVDVLVTPRARDVAEAMPRAAKVQVFDKRGADGGLTGLWRSARRLRARGYEAAALPHRSVRSALLALAAGIPAASARSALRTERWGKAAASYPRARRRRADRQRPVKPPSAPRLSKTCTFAARGIASATSRARGVTSTSTSANRSASASTRAEVKTASPRNAGWTTRTRPAGNVTPPGAWLRR